MRGNLRTSVGMVYSDDLVMAADERSVATPVLYSLPQWGTADTEITPPPLVGDQGY